MGTNDPSLWEVKARFFAQISGSFYSRYYSSSKGPHLQLSSASRQIGKQGNIIRFDAAVRQRLKGYIREQ